MSDKSIAEALEISIRTVGRDLKHEEKPAPEVDELGELKAYTRYLGERVRMKEAALSYVQSELANPAQAIRNALAEPAKTVASGWMSWDEWLLFGRVRRSSASGSHAEPIRDRVRDAYRGLREDRNDLEEWLLRAVPLVEELRSYVAQVQLERVAGESGHDDISAERTYLLKRIAAFPSLDDLPSRDGELDFVRW